MKKNKRNCNTLQSLYFNHAKVKMPSISVLLSLFLGTLEKQCNHFVFA